MKLNQQMRALLESVREKTSFRPKAALVLGSGLGNIPEAMEVESILGYKEIPGMPTPTVDTHAGRFVFGKICGIDVVVLDGRLHFYECHEMDQVVVPLRLARMIGAEILFLTNAVGGIDERFGVGDFMVVRDHVSLFVPSPLRGENWEGWGERYPDMSSVYDAALRKLLVLAGREQGLELEEGILVQTSGPQFESPAEIRLLGSLGCDVVGMSTVAEAIAGRHCGMRVCALSFISNLAAGRSSTPLSLDEVIEAGKIARPKFQGILAGFFTGLARELA